MSYGDSKTSAGGWQPYITAGGIYRSPYLYLVESARVARGGYTVAMMAPLIAADMAGISGTPEIIISNLGANDMASMPDEATWKADYLTIFDAMHSALPNARIKVTKPWRADHDADADTLAGWIDDLVALRPTFVFVGDDERVWFKPNVATYSDDGVHYNAVGNPVAGQQRSILLI